MPRPKKPTPETITSQYALHSPWAVVRGSNPRLIVIEGTNTPIAAIDDDSFDRTHGRTVAEYVVATHNAWLENRRPTRQQ